MRSYWAVSNKALERNTVSPLCKLWNRIAILLSKQNHLKNLLCNYDFTEMMKASGRWILCMLSFFLAEVKHMGEVCLVHLFMGQQGHTFSMLCTFWCFPVGGRSARSERRVALSVLFASCPQGPLMAISEVLHLLTRSSSQQDRLIAPAVSGYLWLSMLPTFTHKGLIIKHSALNTPHRDCWLTLIPGSCFRHLNVWSSSDTDVKAAEKK